MAEKITIEKGYENAQPLTAETIKRQLEDDLISRVENRPVTHLSASRLGDPCEKHLWLLINHWQERKLHDPGLQAIFELGNFMEAYCIQRMKDAGFDVVTPGKQVHSWEIKVKGGVITGREDLRVKDPVTGELIPCEIKGLSPFEFDKLHTIEDFLNSKKKHVRGYPAQLFIYMYKFEKEKGFFLIVNKLTGEIRPIEVHLDLAFGEECLSKAERIYDYLERNVEPEGTEDASLCANCDLKHVCNSVKMPKTDLELDPEFDEMVDRMLPLKEEKNRITKEYDELYETVKERLGERNRVVTGNYFIEVKEIQKKAFTVAERTEKRYSFKKIEDASV